MYKLLIVDDMVSDLASLISAAPVGDSLDISVAENAEDALEILKNAKFDILLTDINMTGLDGFALVRISTQAYPEMRAVMCSGDPYVSEAAALKAGAVALIRKPFSLLELRVGMAKAFAKP